MPAINQDMEKLLNEQFHREVYSANLYLSICSYFQDRDLDGFANFFRVQAEEEMAHAMKQFDYIHQVDGKVSVGAIPATQTEFGSILDAFQTALEHEQYITTHIHKIAKAALEQSDFATHTFLQWFIQEQVEEEATVRNLVARLKLAGENSSAIYLLNDELARRKPEAE